MATTTTTTTTTTSEHVEPLRLRELLSAGPRAVSRYTGMMLTVHAVQLVMVVALMLGISGVFAQVFAHLPMWDEAVDGDLIALLECLRFSPSSFLSVFALVFAAIILWQLISWFLVGGMLGVLVQRPEGRRAVVRCFGASGTATYFAFARLAILQMPAIMLVSFAIGTGLGIARPYIDQALTLPELFGPLILGILPGVVLLHFVWTVTDYARIEIAMRHREAATKGHDVVDNSVFGTYLRTLGYVLRRPLTLLHGAVGWLVWIAITLAYAYVAYGHAMYGEEGAVTLFVARQGIAMLRTAIRVGILNGQIELGRTRPLPPPPVEPKPEAT